MSDYIPDIPGSFPPTYSQESLWLLFKLDPTSSAYNGVLIHKITGELDIPALEKSLNAIVKYQSSFRAIFPDSDGQPYQLIRPFEPFSLPVIEINESPDNYKDHIVQLARSEVRRPFDLATGPLFRFQLYRGEGTHFLLFAAHHIITDAWSHQIFLNDLQLAYSAYATGREPDFPPLSMTYEQYAQYERETMQEETLERQLDFWGKRLGEYPPVLNLFPDHSREAGAPERAAVHAVRFDKNLSDQFLTFCRQRKMTLYAGITAIFNALLYRHTGQETLIIGTPFANRGLLDVERVFGLFVNTLPLRVDVSAETTFSQLLKDVNRALLDALEYQSTPISRLVAALQVERNPTYSPLYNIVAKMPNVPRAGNGLLDISNIPYDDGVSAFDLELAVSQDSDGWFLQFTYNLNLYEPGSIARLGLHFKNLMVDALMHPERGVSELDLFSPDELSHLTIGLNQTSASMPSENIYRVFESWAASQPEAIALLYGDQSISYDELNANANRLAHLLKQRGVGPEIPVGICCQPSPDVIVSLLAVMKAGGICMPIAANYPRERIEYTIRASGARIILTQSALQSRLEGLAPHFVCVDRGDFNEFSGENPAPLTTPDNTALIFYTSGSTGLPKGVQLAYRGIPRLVLNTNYVDVGTEDVVAQCSNVAFDALTFEMWAALANGATLAIIPTTSTEAVLSDELAGAIYRHHVSILFITTAFFNIIAQERPETFSGMRYVLFGGEKADPSAVRRIFQNGRPEHLYNVYGPTECTTFATFHPILEAPDENRPLPIGKPITNTTVYVLDNQLHPVPIGVPGEIVIGGEGVGRGYLNQPGLTSDKFIPDPFASISNAKMYRTGDLGRYLPDGSLQYVGRSDQQVKLRGYRIEPGEIEVALKQNLAIKDAIVILKNAPQGKHLVAFWISKSRDEPNPREFLKERLPDYMIPSLFVKLDSFPMTPSGKIDYKALSQISITGPGPRYSPPSSPIEAKMVQIWQAVMGLEKIGVRDNFFDLGGHSLMAVRLISEIKREFDSQLPVAALFENGTVANLAALVAQKDSSTRRLQSVIPVQPLGSKLPVFWIPSGFGVDLYVQGLAKYFAPNQPLYLLAQPEGSQDRTFIIEELAKIYAREISQYFPDGPYCLVGHSHGGTIACETARELIRTGARIRWVGLLDTGPPTTSSLTLFEALQLFIRNTPALGFSRSLKDLGRNIFLMFTRFVLKSEWVSESILQNRTIPWVNALGPRQSYYVRASVANKYHRPVSYPFELLVFRATSVRRYAIKDNIEDWTDIAEEGVTFLDVPGDHVSIMEEPNIAVLAQKICEQIEA
jgi:amino acid adenylation domain-containing protein